ncbi:hypothetical protein PIIN_02829 [Serendipita indica DSM 11827]|uniref:Uncharacterized protein n=1 Tax=Serendipita indica (strain DSM 11827) TaxID=1109443 RepID=G4TCC6_SERID|nr:hypothetical protein PIIN_02829 [Serendipita indica DSM 11827]
MAPISCTGLATPSPRQRVRSRISPGLSEREYLKPLPIYRAQSVESPVEAISLNMPMLPKVFEGPGESNHFPEYDMMDCESIEAEYGHDSVDRRNGLPTQPLFGMISRQIHSRRDDSCDESDSGKCPHAASGEFAVLQRGTTHILRRFAEKLDPDFQGDSRQRVAGHIWAHSKSCRNLPSTAPRQMACFHLPAVMTSSNSSMRIIKFPPQCHNGPGGI